MNIEVKAIKIAWNLCQETTAFTASLYIDGKKIGWARNEGHGGPTDYGPDNYHDAGLKRVIEKAEEYCRNLPDVKYEDFTFKQTLENFIDDIVDQEVERLEKIKIEKKLRKAEKDAILVGDDNGFYIVGLKRPVAVILALEDGKDRIKKVLDKIKPQMKKGQRILNKNLPEELLA